MTVIKFLKQFWMWLTLLAIGLVAFSFYSGRLPADLADDQACFMLVKGLSRSDCASWVQAWGTIIAVLVAVIVPWFLRTADIAREKQKLDTQLSASAFVITRALRDVLQILVMAKVQLMQAKEKDPSIVRIPFALAPLLSVQRPSESDLNAVRAVDPHLAALIVGGYQSIDELTSMTVQGDFRSADIHEVIVTLEHADFRVDQVAGYFRSMLEQLNAKIIQSHPQ